MQPLSIAITSGGTRVPIDDVRLITNISHGATGAAIATHALERGHHIDYVGNSDTCLPYIGNPLSDAWLGLKRQDSEQSLMNFVQKRTDGALSLHRADNFEDYLNTVENLVHPDKNLDAIILAAAVSDFGPEQVQEGKISSKDGLQLSLTPLPKIRERIRSINPDIIIVAFKQMPLGTTEDTLFDTAIRSMTQGGIDITVANITTSTAGKFSARGTWIIQKDGSHQKIIRRELPRILIEQEIPRLI